MNGSLEQLFLRFSKSWIFQNFFYDVIIEAYEKCFVEMHIGISVALDRPSQILLQSQYWNYRL